MTTKMAQQFWASHFAEIQRLVIQKDRAGYERLLQNFVLKHS